MTTIENMAETIASSIIEEKVLRKDELVIKIKVLLKAMVDIKYVEQSSKFKPTTLDWVSSIANRNKFMSNFWRKKVEDALPEKMKHFNKELSHLLQTEDFSSKRMKKANELGLSTDNKNNNQ